MLRFVQGDVGKRYFQAVRDGAPQSITAVTAKLYKPSTGAPTQAAVIEDGPNGKFYVQFGAPSAIVLDEVGHCRLELVVDGEHCEEPIRVYVRQEFVEGPLEQR